MKFLPVPPPLPQDRAKASLTAAIASYQERIAQIDTMPEEQKINQGE